MNWKKVLHSAICLLLVCSILLTMVPVKADAVALEAALGIGVAACLILMSAGVVFNPKTAEDVASIGNSLSNYLYEWASTNERIQIVNTFIEGVQIDGLWSTDGSDDDKLSPNEKKIVIASEIVAAISGWIASIMLNKIEIEDSSDTSPVGFSYVNLGTLRTRYESSATGNPSYFTNDYAEVIQLIHDAYENRLAIVFCGNSTYLFGFYWTEEGYFSTGNWENPDGIIHASDFGVYSLDSLNLLSSYAAQDPFTSSYVYFSKEICESKSDFLTSSYLALDWSGDVVGAWSTSDFPVFKKQSYNTTWDSSTSLADAWYSNIRPEVVYCPASEDDVVWGQRLVIEPSLIVGDVVSDLESGAITDEEIPLVDINYSMLLPEHMGTLAGIQNLGHMFAVGDLTLDQYLAMAQTPDEGAEMPTIVSGIPYGSEITYLQGQTASPITIIANVSDGGTLSYEWYRYGTDSNGKLYPVEVLDTDNSFLPSTADLGTAYYYCRVINTDTSGLVSYNQTSSIKVSVVSDPDAGSDSETETQPGVSVNPDSIGQVDSQTFWDHLPTAIAQPFETLGNFVVEGVRDIFVPSEDFISDKVDTLMAEFSFIEPVVTLVKAFFGGIDSTLQEPPVIYINLDDTRGSYDIGGKTPFIDMTWYAEYKPTVDKLLSAFLVAVFLWRLFRQLPGIVSGMPGDFVMDGLSQLHIELPSRKAGYEIQRIANRESIRKGPKK